ncbi:unnamed protein product [Eruca vesicaria subsp. sativa]|uniref:J domain-containing protein n=1 Tax=Eruca vesicaria subsp. sativa TaxID=29727 RepID=A0ABC8KKB3_ERUVS|nr:unnamed protein product [Eruca vesicaria subsp. sativa]
MSLIGSVITASNLCLCWKWVKSQKHMCSDACSAMRSFVEKMGELVERHWPLVCSGCGKLLGLIRLSIVYWKDCILRGFRCSAKLGSASLLLIMWSCFLSLTSLSCLLYVLLSMGVAAAIVLNLGCTPGLFIVGLFGILILWMYANFWITGTLFIVGGYLFSINHARLVVLMAALYAMYCVEVRLGWIGVLLSMNLAFLSNDVLNCLLQWCDNLSEKTQREEPKKVEETIIEEDYVGEFEYPSVPVEKEETKRKVHENKSSAEPTAPTTTVVNSVKEISSVKIVKVEAGSADEMKRILKCLNHYEALGFPRHKRIDDAVLKKEYRKKAMLVHPDKNMGSPLASESFKKLQCAYEVLSDIVKKRDYDEQLRKEESRTRSVCQTSHTSHQSGPGYRSEESRCIHCTKCGNSHIWVCTSRTKAKARWCQVIESKPGKMLLFECSLSDHLIWLNVQDCGQYHRAKDGDGWVELKGTLPLERAHKIEIPRAFVCAESKIFDVSEWAICQGMACRPNTHRPSFHVNMVGLEKTTQRSNSSRFPWDLDVEKMDEDEEEFELWLQQALASGLFCETSKRRKSWSPFKLSQMKSKKQWRRTST